jgi:hypothetical protein
MKFFAASSAGKTARSEGDMRCGVRRASSRKKKFCVAPEIPVERLWRKGARETSPPIGRWRLSGQAERQIGR